MFLHRTHIRVKAREDNPSLSSILEHTREDDIQELVHVEVSGQVSIPGAILVQEEGNGGNDTTGCTTL